VKNENGIARRRPPQPSPAKDFFKPAPPPVCQQSWRPDAGAGSELTYPLMPSYPARSSPFEDQQPGTNLRTHADPSSARMPTYIDENAEPALSFYSSFFSSSCCFYLPVGYPSRPHFSAR